MKDFIWTDMKNKHIEEWKLDFLFKPFKEMKHGDFLLNLDTMMNSFRNRSLLVNSFPG